MAGFLWDDLQALVNGHPAAMNTNNIAGYATAAASQAENFSLGHLTSLRINEEDKPFAFPDFSVVNPPQNINLYRELEEIYRPFYQPYYINNAYNNNNNTTTTAIMAPPPPPPQMAPIPPIPNFSNFPNYPYQDTFEKLEQNSLLLPQPQPLAPSTLPPPQQQPLLEPEQQVQAQGEVELPVQPEKQVVQARPRPRGRAAPSDGSAAARNKSIKKSPVKVKKICEVKATKLFDDLWAWRKYGQKPIKGSPFPRNYYRCSSSKGCSARKQVEKSSQGIDMFTVTYTGEHTHPRPPNRIPGTCGSRNKLPSVSTHNRTRTRRRRSNNKTNLNINNTSSIIINNNKNANQFIQQNANNLANDPFMNAFAASYGYSPASLSPNTPLIAASEQPMGEGELTLDELEKLLEEDFNDEGDQEDDEMVMIPNMAMNEDLFMGFQELGWPIPETWRNSFNPPAFGSGSSRSSGSSSNGGKNNRNVGGCF